MRWSDGERARPNDRDFTFMWHILFTVLLTDKYNKPAYFCHTHNQITLFANNNFNKFNLCYLNELKMRKYFQTTIINANVCFDLMLAVGWWKWSIVRNITFLWLHHYEHASADSGREKKNGKWIAIFPFSCLIRFSISFFSAWRERKRQRTLHWLLHRVASWNFIAKELNANM